MAIFLILLQTTSIAPYNETGVGNGNYKVRALKDIGEKPKNLINLDGLEASASMLNKLSGDINAINGFVRITSNNGITDIDLSARTIPSVEYAPLSTDSLVTVESPAVEFASFVSGALTANRDIYISSTDLGDSYAYTSGLTLPTTFSEARYALVQNSSFTWILKKFSTGSPGSWADVSSQTEFTSSSVGDNSLMVLFKNNLLVKLEFSTSGTNANKYIFNTYAPIAPLVAGNFILIKDPATSSKFIVNPSSVSGSISPANLQVVTIQKPQSNNKFFKLSGKSKIIKCSATAGTVSEDSGLIYYKSAGALYTQASGATSLFSKLADGQWLYYTATKQIERNNNSICELVPSGYYNYDDNLVKINASGKIEFDGEQGESINYKLPTSGAQALNARVTVPTFNSSSTLTTMLTTPLNYLNVVSTDMYIDTQLNLKNSSGANVINYNGLYWVNGLTGLTRANKLYRILSSGKCELYTGLAYLEMEPENANGIRVWYSVSNGVASQLKSDDYLLTANNQVIRVGIVAASGTTYNSNLIALTGTVNNVAAFNRTRDGLVAVGTVSDVSDQQLTRLQNPTEVNAYAIRYITLGYMSGGNKTTVSACVALGGVEVINGVGAGHFNNKFYRIYSGSDIELALVDVDGNKAFAKYADPLLRNSAIYLLNATYYTVNTSSNNKLTKVTSGWIFNDADEEKDLRMINSDGSLTDALIASNNASCRHFAWNVNGVKTVFFAKGNAALDVVMCNNNAYENFVLNTDNNQTIMVFLIQIPAEAQAGDEEDIVDTSKYTMYRLKLSDASITPLVPPTATNKQWKFLCGSAGQFNQYEFPKMYAATNRYVYWNISSSVNRPHVNRIVTVSNIDYSTDDYGLVSATPFVNAGKYFTDPSNALLYGSNATDRVKVHGNLNNKYYIDYAGNLAKAGPASGDRLNIVTDNTFVVFDDNDFRSRLYSNGRMVLVTPGTLVAVASSKPGNHGDHMYNGLKMWGKDVTGMYNRWLNMQVDVARQANDKFVSNTVNLYDFVTASTAGALASNNITDYNFTKSGNGALASDIKLVTGITYTSVVDLSGTALNGSDANDPAANSITAADNGKYFYNTTSFTLKKVTNGALAAVDVATIFTLSGKVQTTNTSGVAQGIAGTVGEAVKLTDGKVKLITAQGTAGSFAGGGGGVGATIAFSTPHVFDTTNKKFYMTATGALATTAINYLRDASNAAASWALATARFIKVNADGSADYAPLYTNDGLAETTSGTGMYVMNANVAAGDAIGANAVLTKVKLANGATCLLEIAMATYSSSQVIQKDGSIYWFGSSESASGKKDQLAGNSGTIQLLVIDGMVQNDRAPRGTQIQVAGTSSVKPYTRLGYSNAEANAKKMDLSSTKISDSWVTIA